MQVKLKIRQRTFDINEKDVLMDNGACVQLITKKIQKGMYSCYPIMGKKLFQDLKKRQFLFTTEELQKYANDHYIVPVTLYKFDVERMSQYLEYREQS